MDSAEDMQRIRAISSRTRGWISGLCSAQADLSSVWITYSPSADRGITFSSKFDGMEDGRMDARSIAALSMYRVQ